jgi:lantibiotic modifying enzyme
MITRRHLLLGTGAAALSACASRTRPRPTSPALDPMAYAAQAAAFIRSLAVTTPHGLAWRKSPDEQSLESDYYHGGTGVVRFLLEMYRATGDRSFLDEASRGMDHARAVRRRDDLGGLHGGAGGDAFVLGELFATTGDQRFRDMAIAAIADLEAKTTPAGAGLAIEGGDDVMYGAAAGIVVLLRAAEVLAHAPALDLAHRLGLRLAESGEATPTGRHWHSGRPEYELYNFAHGTAGVAFALAALHARTAEPSALAAAHEGAAWLLAKADTRDGGCRVEHSNLSPGIYYMAPCHGPPGVARLFEQLHLTTGRAEWRTWVLRCATSVLDSGIPAVHTPGYWDNVGQCCGSAAVAEWMLSLHDLTRDPVYTAMADALIADVVAHASPYSGGPGAPDGGLQWIHAENRVEPYWRQSYTGYMQGAAGIGSLFLRLAQRAAGASYVCRPVDNPFPV